MEELREDIKRVGRDTKEKAKEKIHVASEFVAKAKDKEYTFTGDAILGAGLVLGGVVTWLLGSLVVVTRINEKQSKSVARQHKTIDIANFENGVLTGRVSELRQALYQKRAIEKNKEDSQE